MTISKIRYLGGWEVYFEKKELTIDFLSTHGVDLIGFKFFKEVQSALEFEIEGKKLIKGYKHRKDERELKWENIELPIEDWEDHKVFLLEKDPNGIHRVGGSIPKDLQLPTHPDLTSPFQYIGTLDCTDPYFKWINIDKLHIVFPLYEPNAGIYLDYSNPLNPTIIETVDFFAESYKDFQVEYSQVNFKTTPVLDVNKYKKGDALVCGVPLWYQFPHVPKCPISNSPMRFICSIKSDKQIRVVNNEDATVTDNILIFGDMSHLMLFYNPVTKIMFANIEP
ncbi:hypothetical protein [Paenibacillus sp. V4I7]|uniref:hypothetical protein n=1 Tax=Paenibacillus sp. V4I7 TaxID=3042307 RepID=UPI002781B6A9|nr:hypothetical protein [Paenibacillus sp. V4I7]MDQ0899358.1 hypothetical protein [Paenibacillus sp. V4I7]